MSEGKWQKGMPWLVGGLVLVVWAATWRFVPMLYGPPDTPGAFGDMFGVATSLFSAGALFGVIFSIYLQRKDLNLQRQELADTREVLENQRREFEIQNTTLRRQAFETTFFALLRVHHELVTSFRGPGTKTWSDGRTAFRLARDRVLTIVRATAEKEGRAPNKTDFTWAVDEILLQPRADFGHYFRHVESMLKMVMRQFPRSDREVHLENEYEAYFYISVIRSQLSDAELGLLFAFGLHGKGSKLKGYIEEFGLLKDMAVFGEPNDPLERVRKRMYHDNAFEDLLG